jgi:protein gp37
VLTIDEAAAILRISRNAAYAAARQWRATGGEHGLPCIEIGRTLRVPRSRPSTDKAPRPNLRTYVRLDREEDPWHRIFVNSMSDLFHEDVTEDFIRRVFAVMSETPQHTYQVLTKRTKRLARIAPNLNWPSNLWMGASVESASYRFRIDHLRRVPAAVRFISAEPLLGPLGDVDLDGIDWVIAGGESGPRARPMDIAWGRDLRDQCVDQGVKFFFKQWGGRTPKAGGRELDGRTWDDMPITAAV